MPLTVDTLVEALEQNQLTWLTMAPLVDYGFLDLSEIPVRLGNRQVQPMNLLFDAYRSVYLVKKAEGRLDAWKTALHDACIHGTLDVYLTEWFRANDAQNASWLAFKNAGHKVKNPYPLAPLEDSDSEEEYDCNCCTD